MSTPDQPLALTELNIPGRSKDPVSQDPDIWGINIAAALGNFPLNGLLCQAGPWGNMAEGDRLTIFWGTGQNVWVETVDATEVKTQLRMFVPSRHMVDGRFAVSYVVKPLGGMDQASEVMQVLVKLTRPGGHDDNGDGGHSKLIMTIPKEIVDGGIDKDNVAAGVPISIGKADGTPPYPYAAAGDVCRLSWGGIFVFSAALTQEQAEGKAPIIINITEAIIREAGDTDFPGMAVAFEVYDKVLNRSEDWSPEQRVVVAVDATRLDAPLLKEAKNNELNLDALAGKPGTAQIVANPPRFELGDIITVRLKGTPSEGAPIDLEVASEPLDNLPSVVELELPNAALMQLATKTFSLSCSVKKAGSPPHLHSKSQFISAIGEVQRLAAPIMRDAVSGTLNPNLEQVRVEIPFDKSFAEGQVLKIFMLGTTPGLKPYLPDLPSRPITHNDIVAAQPLLYNIDGKHLAPVNGGKAEFYYQQLIAETVLATLDTYEATRAIRESIHTAILQVGEARLELPQPEVAGVVNGVLPADTAGTTLTVVYTETVKGDEVFMFWHGSITGEYTDSIKLNEFTAGQPVPFPIGAELIKGNEGGTVEARYEIKRVAGGTSYAEPLKFRVGVALDLKEPKIKEAPNDTSLDPLDAQSALTAVIDYDGMLGGDKIIVEWIGAPGTLPAGSDTTEPWPVTTVGPQEVPLAVSVLAFNLAKSVTLRYSVTRGTQDPKDSRTRTLAVLQLRVDLSHSPKIIQAADGGDGTELDVSTLTAAATLRGGFWPHIAAGQLVWMRVNGTKKDDTEYKRVVWTGPSNAVNALWMSQGYLDASLPLADLQSLKNLSPLNVFFMASLDRCTDENLALSYPVRTYTVKAVEEAVQVKFTNAPYVIAPKGRLKDIEIQLSNLDGTPVHGIVTLDLPADFNFSDGESGSRDFPSDSEGKISICGVTGAQTSGSYTLVANKGSTADEASATVTAQGQLKNIPIGGGSWEVVISADGTRGYVTSWQKNNISIFDTSTHEVIKTIEDIPFAFGIALSPDERFCYVSNRGTNKVSFIDLALEEPVHTMDTGPGPVGVVLSKDGQWLFVCNFDSNTVTRIDVTSYEVSTIVTGQRPRHGAASPDGRSVYICNAESPDISVIDIETGCLRPIQLSDGACSITFSQSGEMAYAVMDSKVAIIDVMREELIRYVGEVGGRGIAVNRSGEYVFVTEVKSSMLVRVNTLTGAIGPYFKLGETPCQIASSTDGKSLYVCNNETNDVSWVEL